MKMLPGGSGIAELHSAALGEGTGLRVQLGDPRTENGLACGQPIGTCATCTQRRDALYRPFREKLLVLPVRALG